MTKITTLKRNITTLDTRVGSSVATERIRGWKLIKIRDRILLRDEYTCQVCGRVGRDLVVDHIVPLFSGGNNSDHNLQSLCKACHKIKSDKEEGERQ
jgi:5-methylcytosine-specific restriction protein A